MEQIQFLALGGAREIGANAYFYKIGGYGLLVDAGLHPEKIGWDAFPKAELLDPYSVNSFIITHAHTDHLGGMPFLLQSQPQARVIATPETIVLSAAVRATRRGPAARRDPSAGETAAAAGFGRKSAATANRVFFMTRLASLSHSRAARCELMSETTRERV